MTSTDEFEAGYNAYSNGRWSELVRRCGPNQNAIESMVTGYIQAMQDQEIEMNKQQIQFEINSFYPIIDSILQVGDIVKISVVPILTRAKLIGRLARVLKVDPDKDSTHLLEMIDSTLIIKTEGDFVRKSFYLFSDNFVIIKRPYESLNADSYFHAGAFGPLVPRTVEQVPIVEKKTFFSLGETVVFDDVFAYHLKAPKGTLGVVEDIRNGKFSQGYDVRSNDTGALCYCWENEITKQETVLPMFKEGQRVRFGPVTYFESQAPEGTLGTILGISSTGIGCDVLPDGRTDEDDAVYCYISEISPVNEVEPVNPGDTFKVGDKVCTICNVSGYTDIGDKGTKGIVQSVGVSMTGKLTYDVLTEDNNNIICYAYEIEKRMPDVAKAFKFEEGEHVVFGTVQWGYNPPDEGTPGIVLTHEHDDVENLYRVEGANNDTHYICYEHEINKKNAPKSQFGIGINVYSTVKIGLLTEGFAGKIIREWMNDGQWVVEFPFGGEQGDVVVPLNEDQMKIR